MSRAEAIKRYRAAVKLRRLYHAYMATEYGTAIMARRLEGQVVGDGSLSSAERTARLQDLARLRSLSQERFLAFGQRAGQLDERVAELAEWTE